MPSAREMMLGLGFFLVLCVLTVFCMIPLVIDVPMWWIKAVCLYATIVSCTIIKAVAG